jgi:hypothetical protein
MLCQSRRQNWVAVLSVVSAMAWLGLAACGGAPAAPLAPQAPGAPATSDLWTVLSQNPRLAQSTPGDTPAPAGPKLMSPGQARSATAFAFGVPAWAPPGFQLQAQAEVISPSATDDFASVSLDWQNAQGATIELLISRGDLGSGLAGAGADSETLQIGGQPANLRHQTGFGSDRWTLSWSSASLNYRLAAESGAATRDDLVRMANSIS